MFDLVFVNVEIILGQAGNELAFTVDDRGVQDHEVDDGFQVLALLVLGCGLRASRWRRRGRRIRQRNLGVQARGRKRTDHQE